ncbi:uncharacterized protein LY89DRAFT_783633 [Mollisia scopiformis]|uniref:Uncharacterized protein n=1 Tax=Mollisia scopiformis TaxID=149040 RepID=A0A194X5N9_MOLSC|nr:uncharacterized protein LY89DRAFT_783633 [Mollisia scopiformis]KUJ15500.1 hypothetical protein LY89DRAFT_783633 [Mollisia scopiformis]
MGIKGIYGEIGPGERISLSKLAVEKLEKEGRPLRVAIDVSIWQFQTLAGQGGSNPAIRTFYYRLLRLLSFSVQPLFVFDGPHKPPFKRGKKTGHHGACVPNLMTKQMLALFGYPYHMAPGEAEAECALLQRDGIVDAVLSEDVDTLMFGCGLTFRNWSSEGTRGNKSPTHVSVYDAKATKEGKSGLDREGMVLVALMSGGDYITEGIPHCGIKVACEAARAGFGNSLCKLANNDVAGIATWRGNLAHEIRTNESKYFRIKHKTLTIPENFPNREVLGYYTNPVVSSALKVQKMKDEIVWDGEIDIQGLRQFVGEAFDWTNKIGARKFIRNLAPALLVHKLRLRGDRRDSGYGDLVLTAMNEMELVRAICGNRNHFTVDCIKELRVVYSPIDIVGIDLDAEHDDAVDFGRSGLATNNADDGDLDVSDRDTSKSPGRRGPSTYDPTQPDKLWLPETIAKLGVPLKVEDYKESLRNPRKFLKAKAAAKKAAMPKGAMDKFVAVTKPTKQNEKSEASRELAESPEPDLPPVYLAPRLRPQQRSQFLPTTKASRAAIVDESARTNTDSLATKPAKTTTRIRNKPTATTKPQPNTNPWTIARASSSPQNLPKVTKNTVTPSSTPVAIFRPPSPCYITSSSPPAPTPLSPRSPNLSLIPSNGTKHQHSPIPSPTPSPEPNLDLPNTVTITRPRSRRTQDPSTPSKTRDPDHPSPRKRVSPDHPVSIHSHTPEPVARLLNFSASKNTQHTETENHRSQTSSPELPSLAELRSSSSASASVSMQSSRPTTAESFELRGRVEMKKKKKFIMPRKSLAGAWKEIEVDADEDEDDVFGGEKVGKGEERERRWRLSEVEVVDLSAD